MKSSILLLIILALFSPCLAQNNSQNLAPNQTPRKIDEFEDSSWDDDIAHVSLFYDALKKEPTAKAYIITYDARVSRYGDSTAIFCFSQYREQLQL